MTHLTARFVHSPTAARAIAFISSKGVTMENKNSLPKDNPLIPTFPRQVSPGVYWFAACNESLTSKSVMHTHNSCFLVIGSEKSVLIDTASARGWADMQPQLADALGGRKLDYIMPTHPELPHMGNLGPLMQAYPMARLIGDVRNYHLYFPDLEHRFTPMDVGDELDLGNRRVRIVAPVIYDLPNTIWMYEPDAKILFVSDAYPFSHDHRDGECAMMSNELGHTYRSEDSAGVLSGALGWTRYVDAEFTIGNLEAFLQEHPARIIAPSHGGVIHNPEDVTEIFKAGIRNVRIPPDVQNT